MIEGGYYLKARCIQESAIMHAPPHVREIWDWLLMRAMFRDGRSLERGQVVASYQDMREGLSWRVGYRTERYSKWDCEKAMKWLTKETMIATTKTTNGLLITILNYSHYQDPKNYESHNESHNEATREPQPPSTIEKKEKKEKKERRKTISSLDEEWLSSLGANPAYIGIDITRELGKCQAWFDGKKAVTRQRFLNWLNRAERPIQARETMSPTDIALGRMKKERENEGKGFVENRD